MALLCTWTIACVIILSLHASVCWSADQDVTDKLYDGCYADDPDARDLDQRIWSDPLDNDPEACITACRRYGYTLAGLQAGSECWCGNNLVRKENRTEEENCDTPCPANPLVMCGGQLANSIYNVPWDSRSVGCWERNPADLPELVWENTANRSVVQCVDECRLRGYWYAGVTAGGTCHCGDAYGSGEGAEELACRSVPCPGGYTEQACGGETEEAVYNTDLAVSLPEVKKLSTRRIYYDDTSFNGIETRLFVTFPDLRSIVSHRLSLHVTESVSPVLDGLEECADDCYEPCGEIYHVEGLEYTGETLVLRFFHIRLSQLQDYVGVDVRRLYVYAQTVIVDDSLNVPYTLLIRSRNMYIDHTKAAYITVSSTAPLLDLDMEEAQQKGVPSDLLFQKQSYMCARILADTRTEENMRMALAIVYDIAMDATFSQEQQSWAYAMRMNRAEILGTARYDIRVIPFYSKSYLSEVLGIYYDDLLLYKQAFDAMLDRNANRDQHLEAVTELLTINQDTNVYQAQREYDAAVRGVKRSVETYKAIYEQYSITRMRLEDAQTIFIASLEEYQSQSVVGATIDFVKGMGHMVLGSIMISYGAVERGLQRVMTGINGMADAMKNLADTIAKLERMMAAMDHILDALDDLHASPEDLLPYLGDVEMTVQLQMMLVKWQILKDQAYRVLVHGDIITIKGCTEYRIQVLDLCNWGEALTRSLIDLAENMRQCVMKKYILIGKYDQQDRYAEYLQELEQDSAQREAMTVAMVQQEYDIRLDLNHLLLTFCHTYFYEDLRECNAALKPKFGGSLTELLTKVNLARNDGIFLPGGGGSTVSRYVNIRDTDLSPNCTDALLCPVNVFRTSRMLYYRLDMGHPDINDLDKYRVREIVLDFVGAEPMGDNKLLKVNIMASGTFACSYRGTVYDFLSRALGLAYEYHIETKYISIHADVYEPFRNVINHVTPYTTWIIELDERSADIDVSGVTSVRMRLDGTGVLNDFQAVPLMENI